MSWYDLWTKIGANNIKLWFIYLLYLLDKKIWYNKEYKHFLIKAKFLKFHIKLMFLIYSNIYKR